MTKLTSPAPHGLDGLPFNSAQKPYSIFNRHKGKDWKWRYDDVDRSRETYAPVGGTVVAAFNDGGYHDGWGDYVDIQVNRSVKVRLAHHAKGTVRVRVGDTVKQGQRIGTMGATGKTNGGIHLHEGLMIDGKWVNPDPYRGPTGKHLPGTPVPAPAGSTAYKRTQVVLARKGLNLRRSPKTGKKVALIPASTVVQTGHASAGWTPVKWGTRTGWVASEFLRLRTKKVGKNGLWLRDKPGGKARAKLKKGAPVTVLGVHGDTNRAVWVRVKAGDRVGYVHGKYLT